jgi:hypothetical protein
MSTSFSPKKPSSSLKLCTNCKFYKPLLFQNRGTCILTGKVDLVSGQKTYKMADMSRLTDCGEEAQYYIEGPHQFPHIFHDESHAIVQVVQTLTFFIIFLYIGAFFLALSTLKK